ncbi:aspartic proteinase nepenthesin-2-like [Triticum aestivum]|uniref:aspartic proteinase nepenthesin-2-like n=1 Tax=Triticum aestivum TaxID=4565 RepID=UPI000842F2E8|nr:aspartic proteinase nepenthesin-2-like [Triticum aestivum]
MGMVRQRPSGVALAAALVTLQLLLLPSPASSQAQVLLLRYMIRARPLITKVVTDFLQNRAAEGVTDIFRRQQNDESGDVPVPAGPDAQAQAQLGSAAVETAGLVVFDLAVGTRTISGVMDISSQLVWTQCVQTPLSVQPTESGGGSFSWLPCASPACQRVLSRTCILDSDGCSYVATYGSDATAYTSGYLATDTFTFGNTSVPGMVLGCSAVSTVDLSLAGASSVIGFGRGPLSLVSQLNLSRFSYFLATDDSDSSETVIRLGDDAVPRTSSSRSTPLLRSTMHTDMYYVRLTGVQVDGKALSSIPAGAFELQADGSGGVFLSTTVPVTYLEEAAYSVLRRALVSRIQSQGVSPFDSQDLEHLCYPSPSFVNVKVPRLTLVFDGVGAAMELKPENYFFKDGAAGGLVCLTILPSRGGSVLGSLLQTGRNMIYDIGAERLTFETAEAPPPEAPSPSEREEDVSPKEKKTAEAPALSLRLWQWLSKLSLVMKIVVVAIVAAAVVFAWRTYTARQNALPRPAGRPEQ